MLDAMFSWYLPLLFSGTSLNSKYIFRIVIWCLTPSLAVNYMRIGTVFALSMAGFSGP